MHLTYHESAERDRLADEIEVTPEMIEAGIHELACSDLREDDWEAVVYSIFTAMWGARDEIRNPNSAKGNIGESL